ncbi:hypothetical protein Tco_0628654 [Tanacetum coccineum]|uniref:Uncharacterized protein n=1 Tax=Tanacetum coccineum TaxID=301880 RepID=A0ABQ4WQW3_9ASTR
MLKESIGYTSRNIGKKPKLKDLRLYQLAFACCYTKHSQELLNMVLSHCPKVFHQQDKKHATTPRKKQVHFEDKLQHQVAIHTNHVEPMHTYRSPNVPVLLLQDKHLKKVEDHRRKIRSSLKTSNRVDSSISSKRTLDFGNDHFGAIMGYEDYVIGESVISRVYYVEGLGHNLFSVDQFCDSDLEVAFQKAFLLCDNLEINPFAEADPEPFLLTTEDCWFQAMQDEIHEFDRLDVWELVPPPDSDMIIATRVEL